MALEPRLTPLSRRVVDPKRGSPYKALHKVDATLQTASGPQRSKSDTIFISNLWSSTSMVFLSAVMRARFCANCRSTPEVVPPPQAPRRIKSSRRWSDG